MEPTAKPAPPKPENFYCFHVTAERAHASHPIHLGGGVVVNVCDLCWGTIEARVLRGVLERSAATVLRDESWRMPS